jgi:osmoprotectant transport system permease protein
MTAVLVGCVSVAALALVLDGLIRALEVAAARRSLRLGALAGVAVLAVMAGGLWPVCAGGASGDGPLVRIGTKTFTEQYVLGRLLERRLQAAGFATERLDGLGSKVVFDALAAGRIDVYVDYTGTIWANLMKRADNPGAAQVLAGVAAWLAGEHGIRCLGPLGFENAYAMAMPRARARELGVESLADLAVHAPELAIGGDYEFFQRPEWAAVRDAYGLRFQAERSFDSSLMYAAVAQGEVDVLAAFSSDGRIAAHDLSVLADPRQALPPYDAVLLLSRPAAEREELVAALEPLIGAIDDERMRRANMWVDVEDAAVGQAARRLDEAIGD